MNYYNEIKARLIKSEIFDRAKDYSKDRNKVSVYFEIGRLLSNAGKEYGKNIIKQYSERLMIDVGKKYNERNLRYMRQFYETFISIKWNPVGSKLSYRELLIVKNTNAIKYYIDICERNNLTKIQLKEKIKNNEYDRLSEETKEKLILSEQLMVTDLVPNPIIIKINSLNEKLTEYALKQAILNNLDEFLFQLGHGFSYIGNEYKIKFGERYNYIDLLLFNYVYNCFVVIELKVTELKSEYVGQIMKYMNYIDKNVKGINQDLTIGIIICKKDNHFVMEYYSDERIYRTTYELVNI